MKVNNLGISEFANATTQLTDPKTKFKIRKIVSNPEKLWFFLTLILTFWLVIVFILFYWFQSENTRSQKNYQRELIIKDLETSISNAVIDVNRNDFELARQTSSEFFGGLDKEITLDNESVFNADQLTLMKSLVDKRVSLNQFLAEKNPKARDELVQIWEAYQKATKGFQPVNRES